jgi:glutathione peroxidase
MKRFVAVLAASVVCLTLVSGSFAEKPEAKKGDAKVAPALNFTMDSLEGKPVKLSQYQGKVVLIVNVASQCGLTPQYEDLEEVNKKYHDKGLTVLGFPANEFGKQEPGTNKEIAEFCKKNYGVDFPMFSKVVVKGEGQCDLYKFLTSKETNPKFAGDIKWNFEKFLLNRHGEVVARFEPKVSPTDETVIKAIEAELAKE